MNIQDVLKSVKPNVPVRRLTEEEYEALKRKSFSQYNLCASDCEFCHGSGFVSRNPAAQVGDSDFGKIIPCPSAKVTNLYSSSRLGLCEEERGWTWDRLTDDNGIGAAVRAIRETLDRGCGWVYVWSPAGLGKTDLLKIAVAEWLRHNRVGAFTAMYDIIEHIKAGFDSTEPDERSYFLTNWYSTVPLLAVDEFEKIQGSEWAGLRRFSIFNKRYEEALRGNSITLIASNIPPQEIRDPYLEDRILDGRFKVVELQGDSMRPGMEW